MPSYARTIRRIDATTSTGWDRAVLVRCCPIAGPRRVRTLKSCQAPIQGIDGIFYGTTAYGGSSSLGTVFKF